MRESEVEFVRRTGEGSAYRPLNFCSTLLPGHGGLPAVSAALPMELAPQPTMHLARRIIHKLTAESVCVDGHDLCAHDSSHGTTGQGKQAQ